MQSNITRNAPDSAFESYVRAFVATKNPAIETLLRGAHADVISVAQANITVLMIGRVLRDCRRANQHPMELATTQGHQLFEAVSVQYVNQLRNDLAREGRTKVLNAALHRGAQDFHGGRIQRETAEAHDALRAEIKHGHHVVDAVLCQCAQLVAETTVLYVDATLRGRETFPDTLVADALAVIRVTEGKLAKPARTAEVFFNAANNSGVELPTYALPVLTDVMYHLSGWDARLSEGAFFARLADRHLGDRHKWHEVAHTIAEVFAAARGANPQSRSTLEKNVDRVWADRFGEPLDLDSTSTGNETGEDNNDEHGDEMGDGTDMAA